MLLGISGKLGAGKDTVAQLIMEERIKEYSPHINLNDLDLAHQGREFLSRCQVKKFATKLRQMLSLLTGCTEGQLEDRDFKNSYVPAEWATNEKWPTYREALQFIGTDLFRNQWHPETWMLALFADYKMIPSESRHWAGHAITIQEPTPDHYPDWIVTDVRFPDEVMAIKKRGGIVIRVEREAALRDPEAFAAYEAFVAYTIGQGLTGHTQPMEWDKKMYDATLRIAKPHESETALDNYDGFDAVIYNNGTLEDLRSTIKDLVTKFNLK